MLRYRSHTCCCLLQGTAPRCSNTGLLFRRCRDVPSRSFRDNALQHRCRRPVRVQQQRRADDAQGAQCHRRTCAGVIARFSGKLCSNKKKLDYAVCFGPTHERYRVQLVNELGPKPYPNLDSFPDPARLRQCQQASCCQYLHSPTVMAIEYYVEHVVSAKQGVLRFTVPTCHPGGQLQADGRVEDASGNGDHDGVVPERPQVVEPDAPERGTCIAGGAC